MLGQAHTPLRRFLPFVAVVVAIGLCVLAVPAVGGADPSHSASSLRAHDTQLATKSRSAVLGLYSLDQQLAAARSRLARLEAQAVALRAEGVSVAHQLAIARRGSAVAQRRLAVRLRLLYESGNVEPLEVILGAKNLDEALTSLDDLRRVSSQGEDVLHQLQDARRRTRAAQAVLVGRRAALAQAVAQAHSTAASLAAARTARIAYLGALASERRLTRQRIDTVVAQARAAHVRSQQLAGSTAVVATAPTTPTPATAAPSTSEAPPAGVTTGATAAGGRTITVTATGYSLAGSTATGLPTGWGVVAVDPSVIPLGSHLWVPGYGEAVAADTGGAVVGATIDVWFPSEAQAKAWGRTTVTVVVH